MNKPLVPHRFQWGILAGFGLIVPLLIAFMRSALMSLMLGAQEFRFIPLTEIVNGRSPHIFSRVMLNLTHPVFLFGYALLLTCVTIKFMGRPLSQKSNQLMFCGIASLHLVCLSLFLIAFLLPTEDLVSGVAQKP
jgi:hypothetical protein